jgi:hypothetical protein
MNYQRYWKSSILFFAIGIFLAACGAVQDYNSNSKPISHAAFDSLLRKHVDEAGMVNYEGFIQDSVSFKEYLQLLSDHHPNDENWPREERIAYWINAYNAFTIKLIMDHYPVESIKDIKNGIPFVNTVWDIKFINIEGAEYDLNNLEHGILRPKYNEPRIHFAVNCASISCPKLQRFAYTGEKLDEQLDQAARDFLTDPDKNKISADRVQLSKILNWYWGDFKDQYDSRIELVNKYVNEIQVKPEAEVDFLDYDWGLNDQ